MIEDFVNRIPQSVKLKSGTVFYSGRSSFSKQSDLYILGMHPGGEPHDTPESFISRDIEHVLNEKCPNWSAYRDDSWGPPAGKYPLQRNVLHLLKQVGANPHDVPASEVVFLCSKNLHALERKEGEKYEVLADKCWPFHEAVIDKLEVRVVAVYGKRSGGYVCRRLNAHKQVDEFVATYGKGKSIASGTYTNDKGQFVVTLWFPGMGNPWWTKPYSDPTGLVVDALKS